MTKEDKEIKEVAESRYFNANLKSLKKSHFIKGAKWYRDSFSDEFNINERKNNPWFDMFNDRHPDEVKDILDNI